MPITARRPSALLIISPSVGCDSRFSAIRALILIKRCAAGVNLRLGLLKADLAEAILQAATEALDGRMDDQFVVSVFQTGSGTSSNMNVNEVLASRANEILTAEKRRQKPRPPQ